MTVSYLIPVYNKEKYIRAVLDAAIAEQAKTGGEIFVYNDLSTDRSPEIVRDVIAAHSETPIKLIDGEVNCGVALATNRLIGLGAQPYIRLIDGDDVVVKGSTAHLMRLMQKNNFGFIFGRVNPQGRDIGLQSYQKCFSLHDPIAVVLRHLHAIPASCLFNAEDLKKTCPLPEWARHTQDFAIFLRVACQGTVMGGVDEIVAQCPAIFDENNQSSASAASYAEMSRTVAFDADKMPLRNLRNVTRRYAGRAAKYFNSEGESKLSAGEKFTLWRWRNLAWTMPKHTCVKRLRKIADIFDRDRHVIKGFRRL